jgi:hypothetical protein
MSKRPREIVRLREQVEKQRALLRRAQRWVGVAAGAIVCGAPRLERAVHSLNQDAHDALALGSDISRCLAEYD